MDRTATDDRAFEAILLSARTHTADLQRTHDATTGGGAFGCREVEGIVATIVAPLAKES